MNERARALVRADRLIDGRHGRYARLKAEWNQLGQSLDQLAVRRAELRVALAAALVEPPDEETVTRLATALGADRLPRLHRELTSRRDALERERASLVPGAASSAEQEVRLAELEAEDRRLTEEAERFALPALEWLGDLQLQTAQNAEEPFQRFWRAMTLADQRERLALDEVRDRLDVPDLAAALEQKREHERRRSEVREELADLVRVRDAARAAATRRAEIDLELERFPGLHRVELRDAFARGDHRS